MCTTYYMCTTYWLVLGGVALRFFTGQDGCFLAWPKTRLNVASDIPSCFLILFRGTLAFQSSTATRLSSIEKFGTALEGGFLLGSMVPLVLILKRPHTVLFICSQTKSFRLKTVKFRVEQPETHRDTEKKTAGLWDKQGQSYLYVKTAHFHVRVLYLPFVQVGRCR